MRWFTPIRRSDWWRYDPHPLGGFFDEGVGLAYKGHRRNESLLHLVLSSRWLTCSESVIQNRLGAKRPVECNDADTAIKDDGIFCLQKTT